MDGNLNCYFKLHHALIYLATNQQFISYIANDSEICYEWTALTLKTKTSQELHLWFKSVEHKMEQHTTPAYTVWWVGSAY